MSTSESVQLDDLSKYLEIVRRHFGLLPERRAKEKPRYACDVTVLLHRLPYSNDLNLYVPIAASHSTIFKDFPYNLFVAPSPAAANNTVALSERAAGAPEDLIASWLLLAAAFARATGRLDKRPIDEQLQRLFVPLDPNTALLAYSFQSGGGLSKPDKGLCEFLSQYVERRLVDISQNLAERLGRLGNVEVRDRKNLLEATRHELTDVECLPPYYPLTHVCVYVDDPPGGFLPLYTNPLGMSAWLRRLLQETAGEAPNWIIAMPDNLRKQRTSHGQPNWFVEDVATKYAKLLREKGVDPLARLISSKVKDICVQVASMWGPRETRFRYWVRFNVLRDQIDSEKGECRAIKSREAKSHLQAFVAILDAVEKIKHMEYCVAATVWMTQERRDGAIIAGWYITAAAGKASLDVPKEREASSAGSLTRHVTQAPPLVNKVKCEYIPFSAGTNGSVINTVIEAASRKHQSFDRVTQLAETLRRAFDAFQAGKPQSEATGIRTWGFPDENIVKNQHTFTEKAATLAKRENRDERRQLLSAASKHLKDVMSALGYENTPIATGAEDRTGTWINGELLLLQVAKCFSKREIPLALLHLLHPVSGFSYDNCFGASKGVLVKPETSGFEIDLVRRQSMLLIGLVTLLREKEKRWAVFSSMLRPLLQRDSGTTWDYRITLLSAWDGPQNLQDLGIEKNVGDHPAGGNDDSKRQTSMKRNVYPADNVGTARGPNKETPRQHPTSSIKADEVACAEHGEAEHEQQHGSCSKAIQNIIRSDFASCMVGKESSTRRILISVRLECHHHSHAPVARWCKTLPKDDESEDEV